MATPLDESYSLCCRYARKTARNFYHAFRGLPSSQFRSMCTLYSYMRICDDIGDDNSVPLQARRQQLILWEGTVRRFLGVTDSGVLHLPEERIDSQTSSCESEMWVLPALRDIVSQYSIPEKYLLDVICGIRMDLDSIDVPPASTVLQCRHQTFDELRNYCYHVAGVVGLCCIHIWGFQGETAVQRAVDCGLAFQLTNILSSVLRHLSVQTM